ncbi:MerR family DNA-binding protein [Streptomyces coffeae]|uniref:MerR family DNA-binding protein n=1 Tax=Streptomyces coffeae TaxID=621382 RepID=A0ABS1NEM2_9ACTN|nr:MerR family DNA-binding protein [Streptomyces coffeae]MBL1098506.1 MerR family DNA-binding protein [Streptomyces coffeae]
MEALTPIRDQLYRIALIQLWRETGQMSIEEIATVLAADGPEWRDTVAARIAAVEEQQARLDGARDYLSHLLTCRRGGTDLERCPEFRGQVDIPGRRAPVARARQP